MPEQSNDVCSTFECIDAVFEIHSCEFTEASSQLLNKKPFLIACSGGGGHIAAILAFLKRYYSDRSLMHYPMLTELESSSLLQYSILAASIANQINLIKQLTASCGFPIVPEASLLIPEIKLLKKNTEPRPYVDMLLHVQKTGYANAAIWNVLQRSDQTAELLKLIDWQPHNDQVFYEDTRCYFLNALMQAHESGAPYTEVVSTQAMSLAALCDAVREYNARTHANITIHQYMTDLPTRGAVHFFNALAQLTPEQQQQMTLYGVNLTDAVLQHFFKQGLYFQQLCTINPKNNPMVRSGFYDSNCDNSRNHGDPVELIQADQSVCRIDANKKIATIMLGSQASTSACEYILALTQQGIDQVFLFGGANHTLQTTIEHYSKELREKIVLLEHQTDSFISALMTRSCILIIRAGGLSVMEQMAMNHPIGQSIFIHHPHSNHDELTAGIPWEDHNANALITALIQDNIRVLKTSPSLFFSQLSDVLTNSQHKEVAPILGEDWNAIWNAS